MSCSCRYLNDRIGILNTGSLSLIGCYLTYAGGKNRIANAETFKADIELIKESKAAEKSKNRQVMVLGDFNTDFVRINEHSKELLSLLRETHMQCADLSFTQNIDYTYSKKIRGKIQKSWIDHIFNCNTMVVKLQNYKQQFIITHLQ